MSHRGSLDWLNFLLADVRGGLGPYVSVFLLTEAHWDQATIGAVLTVSGLIGISSHAPIGSLIDATHRKRALLIGGVVALSACALAIWVANTGLGELMAIFTNRLRLTGSTFSMPL